MSDFNLGTVTAYGYAKDKGYTGTEDEFAELMASYAQVAEDAAESAEQAAQSATTATTKAGEAATSATNAANANTAAQAAKTGAETAAQTATTKADEASGSAATATTKAADAATSATNAAQSATTATTKAGESATSATNAAASATSAAGSAQTAQDVADSIPADYTQMSDDVDTLKTDVSTLKEDYSDILNSAYVTDTASGSIASFPDGANNVPVKILKVNIEPVQDLHGQDAPYPAGGGKNLFDFKSDYSDWSDGYLRNDGIPSGTVPAAPAYERTSPFIAIKGGLSYVFSFANIASATISNNMCFYDADKNFIGTRITDGAHFYIAGTAPENAAYVRVSVRTFNGMSNVQLEVGSTATTYAPYENICPISGHTQAKVTRTGKNLASFGGQGYWNTSGVFTPDTVTVHSSPVFVKNGQSVSVKSEANTVTSHTIAVFKDKSLTEFLSRTASSTSKELHFTATQDCYVTVQINANFVAITEANYETVAKEQIEYGAIATAYEPYNGQTVTIDLDGTRYGGTLDATTGVLTVDKGFHTFNGTEAWEDYSSFSGFVTREINGLMKSGIRQDGWSNMLKVSKDSTAGQTNAMWLGVNSALFFAIGVYESMGNTVDAFKTYLSEHNLELVYPLANPFTVQLTAQEVTTLLGQNNIWASTGDAEVEYRADTKLYIEKLTAPTEDDMIADHPIAANSFFMIGNTLYRATTAIASGATITVGTNATKMSLSDALNALA